MARKSTSKVLENVQGSADAKAHAAILTTIPNPTFAEVSWDSLKPDRTFNVREEGSYTKQGNADLYTSLKEVGFDRSKPMMAVSLKPDGSYLLLRGYVRHAMMTLIREETVAFNKDAKPEDVRPIPFETIPLAVYGSPGNYLTREQETAIMADHTGSRPLNNYERCTMIGRAWEAAQASGRKLSDKALAANLGVSEATAQRDRYTYSMPTVYENLRKQTHDEDGAVKIIQDDLHALYKAYLDDQAVLNSPRKEGVNFRKQWDIVRTKVTALSDGSKPKLKTPSEISAAVKGLEGYDQTAPETALLQEALKWFIGEPSASCGGSLADLIESRKVLESKVNTLTDERDSLKMELAEVRKELEAAKAECVQLYSTIEGMTKEQA